VLRDQLRWGSVGSDLDDGYWWRLRSSLVGDMIAAEQRGHQEQGKPGGHGVQGSMTKVGDNRDITAKIGTNSIRAILTSALEDLN